MNIDNHIALVTGGASGLGYATVKMLAHKGMKVVALDKNKAHVPEAELFIPCDVANAVAVENAMDTIIENLGSAPRVCVNCAGIATAKRMVGKEGPMALDAFKQVIDINLTGTFNVMRIVADRMSKLKPLDNEERGVIINTASVAAFEGQIGQIAYSASKGGIVAITLPAARELGAFGIRVNTIAPGIMATPMLLGMPVEVQDSLSATVTFPKRLGHPDEYAALVVHIIENTLINGEVIRLDGALRMQAR